MIALLAYDKPNVRAGAAQTLRTFADPQAIPFLLDRLERETNPVVLVADLSALRACAHHKTFPSDYQRAGGTAIGVAYWQQWAINHAAQVSTLRAQHISH